MRRKSGSGHYIGQEFPEQFKKTLLLTLIIRRINESDVELTPKEQAQAIKMFVGLPAYKMESLIPISGPVLADSIRKMISPVRATNRSQKDKGRIRVRKVLPKKTSSD